MRNYFLTVLIGILFLFASSYFSSCKKKEEVPQINYEHSNIDTALKNRYNFKPGSYWIYTNPDLTLDSVYVTDYKVESETLMVSKYFGKVYEVIRYTFGGQPQVFSGAKLPLLTMKENYISSSLYSDVYRFYYYKPSPECDNDNYPSGNQTCVLKKDSVELTNGKKYKNVSFCLYQYFGSNKYIGNYVIKTRTMMVPDVGIVWFRNDGIWGPTDMQLLRYNIVK